MAEEELIEVKDLLSDWWQPDGRGELALFTAAKDRIVTDQDIPVEVLASTARAVPDYMRDEHASNLEQRSLAVP